MSLEILGRKLGMTQVFRESGDRVPVTVLRAGPCTVVQKKTAETDGYSAVQLGFEERKEKHTSKPQQGHFSKSGGSPKRFLYEVRLSEQELAELELGQEISAAESFEAGQKVDVRGVSKGKGFAGVVKRHNYKTHSSTHGTHEFFRHGGAMSAGTYPGRILPGKKMAGHMGDARVTQVGLRIERIDAERNLVFVSGSVPGAKNSLVRIRTSVKK
jgi:large subunit ribosomal protein L3